MPTYDREQVTRIWKNFAHSLKDLFSGHLPKHRHIDQFMTARDSAIDIAGEDATAEAIGQAYGVTVDSNGENDNDEIAKVVNVTIQELEGFPSAVSIYKAKKQERTLKEDSFPSLLKCAKTVIGSVSDILKLTDKYKKLMIGLKQVIELFED